MEIKTRIIIIIILMLLGLRSLWAQSPWDAAQAWSNCDFRPYMIYDKYHIAMMGDSNGARGMVPPKADAFAYYKRWETYLNPKPRFDANWKVLHTPHAAMQAEAARP